jgi:hypothetical protein
VQGLTQREARSVLDFVREVAAARDLPIFRARVATALPDLVRCDLATYNDLDLQARSVTWTASDPDRLFAGAIELFRGGSTRTRTCRTGVAREIRGSFVSPIS